MSRLTDLIAKTKLKDADLGRELEKEFKLWAGRRSFGICIFKNFDIFFSNPGAKYRALSFHSMIRKEIRTIIKKTTVSAC